MHGLCSVHAKEGPSTVPLQEPFSHTFVGGRCMHVLLFVCVHACVCASVYVCVSGADARNRGSPPQCICARTSCGCKTSGCGEPWTDILHRLPGSCLATKGAGRSFREAGGQECVGGSHCWRAPLLPSDVWKVPSILAPTCPSGTVLKCLLSPRACSCHIKPHYSGELWGLEKGWQWLGNHTVRGRLCCQAMES